MKLPETPSPDPHASRCLIERSVLLDRAYDDYCRQAEQGAAPDPDEFCERFPGLKSSLHKLLEAHLFFRDNPQLLGGFGPTEWPAPGETFLGFRLLSELGRGAFARVFLAAETALGDRPVVVKVSRQGAAEAQTLGPLEHPNIVPVNSIQIDPASSLTVICMPYRGGATLGDLIDRAAADGPPVSARALADTAREGAAPEVGGGAPPEAAGTYVDAVAAVAAELADALAFVHSRGICHQDLKPSNVLLGLDGRPLLLDFNLASGGPDPGRRVGGTLPYMPPETLGPAAVPAGPGGDLYALGVIIYEMLTGKHPFGPVPLKLTTEEARSLLLERQRHGPRPVRDGNPAVGEELARLVASCLAFDRHERPASAAVLAAALRNCHSPRPRVRRRRPWLVAAAAATVLAAVLVLPFALPTPVSSQPPGPTSAEAGLSAYRAGRFQAAVNHFSQAISAGSADPWVRYYRGRAHQQLGEHGPAVEDLNQSSKQLSDAKVLAALGYSLCRQGQPGPAAECFRKAVDAGLATAAVYNDLGFARFENGQYDAAKKALDSALDRDPDLRPALHMRARVHLDVALNRPEAAREGIVDVERALRAGPRSAELHYDAACLYALAGRGDDALKQLEAALERGRQMPAPGGEYALRRIDEDPRFAELRARKPGPCPAQDPAPRLIDPVGD